MVPQAYKTRLWPKLFVPAFLFAASLSAQQVATQTASSLQIVQQPKFQIRISGFVLRSDSLRGAGASIQISNGIDTVHTISDANGYFALTLNAAANDTLLASVRLSGYNPQQSIIQVAEGQLNYVMNVRMHEVLITESRRETADGMERHYMGIPAQFDEVVVSNNVVGAKHIRMRHFFHRILHPFKHKCTKH
ncbi:MAG: carboxypeptidase regulatory-like domain-containing protein [Bacteroidetes bacterium]|nr:carboxypeptidase regulatory-like domain-containing protein [Bacteroidota bacterium]